MILKKYTFEGESAGGQVRLAVRPSRKEISNLPPLNFPSSLPFMHPYMGPLLSRDRGANLFRTCARGEEGNAVGWVTPLASLSRRPTDSL